MIKGDASAFTPEIRDRSRIDLDKRQPRLPLR
jgi:hypothetical protein